MEIASVCWAFVSAGIVLSALHIFIQLLQSWGVWSEAESSEGESFTFFTVNTSTSFYLPELGKIV